jgi:hypothetical protein
MIKKHQIPTIVSIFMIAHIAYISFLSGRLYEKNDSSETLLKNDSIKLDTTVIMDRGSYPPIIYTDHVDDCTWILDVPNNMSKEEFANFKWEAICCNPFHIKYHDHKLIMTPTMGSVSRL